MCKKRADYAHCVARKVLSALAVASSAAGAQSGGEAAFVFRMGTDTIGGGTYGDQRCFPLPDIERNNNPNIARG